MAYLTRGLRYTRSWLATGLVLGSLAACTTLTPVARDPSSQLFRMDGRMAVQYAQDGANKDSSGKIHWEEYPEATDITLSTPFDNAIAMIHLTPTESVYKGADGSVVTETSPDMLFYRLFGMDLPIANLREWIGRPDQALIKERVQNGWRVVVTDTFAGQPQLARRLDISRAEPVAMNLYVQIDQRSDALNSSSTRTPAHHTPEIDLGQLLPETAPVRAPIKPK